jgi:branched-chain amino acid transport system substrate-binding protein
MGPRWHVARRSAAMVAVAATLVAACGNSPGGGGSDATADQGSNGSTPGVTDSTILVGGLIAVTGPLGQQFRATEAGFRAYIEHVNEQGGVHGRTIEVVRVANDNTDTARNLEEARGLVERDGVFAVAPVSTPVFGAAEYLAERGVPTFGWNIQDEWRFGESLIGHPASWFREDPPPEDPQPIQSYIARTLGFSRVGVMAYTAPQSRQCGQDTIDAFRHYGLDVVFEDLSLPFGVTDVTADVQKMRDEGVEYLVTCMDVNGNVLVARTLQRERLDISMSWPTGYEQEALDAFGADLFRNVYFTTAFLPFESAELSPGMQLYLQELPARAPDAPIGNQSIIGWISAMLFVEALEAAGPEPTREAVIAAVRAMDDFDADGILPPTDYTAPPEVRGPAPCGGAVVTVEGSEFVQVFEQPFLCLGSVRSADALEELIQAGAAGS